MNSFITGDVVALHTAQLIAEAEEYRLAKSFRRSARKARRADRTQTARTAPAVSRLA